MRDYSQFGEQPLILKFFEERGRTKGRFLDIGAHDGVSCSNTLALAELGWGGVLVEPSPIAFTKLISTYADRPDIEFANVAIAPSPKAHLVPFYEGGGLFVGTLDEAHRNAWEGKQHVHYRKIWTNAIGFMELLEVLPGPYHFVSIDTEGTNISVLDALLKEEAYSRISIECELICVEHDDSEELRKVLWKHDRGFQKKWDILAQTEANTLLVRL